jgi:hypothetical protein
VAEVEAAAVVEAVEAVVAAEVAEAVVAVVEAVVAVAVVAVAAEVVAVAVARPRRASPRCRARSARRHARRQR